MKIQMKDETLEAVERERERERESYTLVNKKAKAFLGYKKYSNSE